MKMRPNFDFFQSNPLIKGLVRPAALCMLMAVMSNTVAQQASQRTKPVRAVFKAVPAGTQYLAGGDGDLPTEVNILTPESFRSGNGTTRGFKKAVDVKDHIGLSGTIRDGDGIRSVTVNNVPVTLLDEGFFTYDVPVTEGMKAVVINVTDGRSNVHEASYAVNVKGPVGRGAYYALLIGVDDYDDPAISDLDKPVADARRLGDVLERYYTFPKEHITYLANPTRSEIIDALDEVSSKLTAEDNFLMFYAGHGYWDEDKETGFWLPSDGRKNSTANWFRNTTLTDQLRTINTKHTLLVADACFSGSIFKSRSVFIKEVAVQKLYELPSRKAMTSGTLTEVPDKSAFLKYLVKRLETNTESYLPSSELFSSFRRAVINNSDNIPQYGTIQKAGDEGGDFIFIRK